MPRYDNPAEAIAYTAIDIFAQRTIARSVELRVEGAEWLPPSGPLLIAARHYHNLLDGLILLRHARRPVRLLVTLDWARTPFQRRGMELACRLARWPAVLRTDDFLVQRGRYDGESAYHLADARPMLRAATRLAVDDLRRGETLVVFPEAYPNIDPLPSPKADGRDFLPFDPGFVKLAQLTERDGHSHVAIVPAGFAYVPLPGEKERWRVTLRYGEPRFIAPRAPTDEVRHFTDAVENAVRTLSLPAQVVA